MPRAIDGVEIYARNPANRQHRNRQTGRMESWNGLCEAFVNNAGDFDESFPTALAAGSASGPLDPDWTTARRGEIHYWAGVGGNGHVAFELGGGLLLMASASVTDMWGDAMGTIPFRTYALKGIPYRGHTARHGGQTLVASSLSSLGTSPIEPLLLPPPPEEEPEMLIIKTPSRGFYTAAPGAVMSLPDDEIIKSIKDGYWQKAPPVWDVADIDLERFLFTFAGCGKWQIPAIGEAWFGGSTSVEVPNITELVSAALADALKEAKIDITLPDFQVTSTIKSA